jgi:hypothetical protein
MRDLENIEFHLLDTGHFALEEDWDVVSGLVWNFMETRVIQPAISAGVRREAASVAA